MGHKHGAMRWPEREEARRLLGRLGTPERDVPEIMAHYPEPSAKPGWWPLLVDTRDRLLAKMDQPLAVGVGYDDIGSLSPGGIGLGSAAPFFGIYVLLAALPDVLDCHGRHGVPEEVSWRTLGDLGRQIGIYRKIHGRSGFEEFGWLSRGFRGLVFHLGRLQFERSFLHPEWRSLTDLAEAAGPQGRVLQVHIPEGGPLSPELCDESLALALDFFPRYFPDEEYRVGTCGSWLLDEQVAAYLPEGSNIMRFQRRFTLLPGQFGGDGMVLRFIFYKDDAALDELPQHTVLERAVVTHLKAGGHWHGRFGWLRIAGRLQVGGPPTVSRARCD
jgi:hypothetical protein